jgi:hypothetical protein
MAKSQESTGSRFLSARSPSAFKVAAKAVMDEIHHLESGLSVGISSEAYGEKLTTLAAKVGDLKRVGAETGVLQSEPDARELCEIVSGILADHVTAKNSMDGLTRAQVHDILQTYVQPLWTKDSKLTKDADKLYSRLK